jgi:hypothetical protein
MSELISGFNAERAVALLSLLSQAAALLVVVWMLLRVERRLDESHVTIESQAARCTATLSSVQQAHRALHEASQELSAATRAWTAAPPAATFDQVSELLTAISQLQATPTAAPEPQPPGLPPATPNASHSHDRQLRAQLEAETTELRRKLQDRTVQLSEMQRERRRLAQEASSASALEAVNRQLLADIGNARAEARTAQSSLQAVALELRASRFQIERLSASRPAEPANPSLSAQESAAYLERIAEVERAHHELQDSYETLRMEHARTLQEKAFIESHYLVLAEP